MIDLKEKLIEKVEKDGDLIRCEDGYWVFWPSRNHGAFQAYHLRIIAEELDKRNIEFEKEMDALS